MRWHVPAVLTEFDRDLIVERTHDGLAAIRARGRVGVGRADQPEDRSTVSALVCGEPLTSDGGG